MNKNVILASESKYKKKLLKRLHVSFQSIAPNIDEAPYTGETAEILTRRLAEEKAKVLVPNSSKCFVISTDQAACANGEIIGKPKSCSVACKMLSALSGQNISFYTSLCLITPDEKVFLHTEKTIVALRSLTFEEIERYVMLDQPLDCAGSFKVESLGISLFKSIQSSDPTALEGLPLLQLSQWLRDQGFKIP